MIVTVAPSGGDYTTIAAAEAANQQDLTALGEVFEIRVAAGTYTLSSITIDGWTTSAAYYIRIVGDPAVPLMPVATSGIPRLTNTSSIMSVLEQFVRVERLQFESSFNSASSRRCLLYQPVTGAAGNFVVDRCIFQAVTTLGTGNHQGVFINGSLTSPTVRVTNCLFLDFFRASSTCGGYFNDGSTSSALQFVANNTFVNCSNGVRVQASPTNCFAINNLFSGCTTDFSGGWDSGSGYNATDTAVTPPGSNNRTSQTFTFVNAGTDDYHLSSTDGGAKGFGSDLSGHATYPFSTDFDGDTISGAWCIGADWITSDGGTPSPTYRFYGGRNRSFTRRPLVM